MWKSVVGSNHRLILSSLLSKPSAKILVCRVYGCPSTFPRNSKSISSRLGWSEVSCNVFNHLYVSYHLHHSKTNLEIAGSNHLHNRPLQCLPSGPVPVWSAYQSAQIRRIHLKQKPHLRFKTGSLWFIICPKGLRIWGNENGKCLGRAHGPNLNYR